VSGFSRTSVVSGFSRASVVSGFSRASVVSGFSRASVVSGFSRASVVSGFSRASVVSSFSRTSVVSGFSRTLSRMRFLRLDLAWWIVAALVAVGVVRWRVRRTFAASTTVRWLSAPKYRASILRGLPTAVLVAALILIGCALMDPVLPYAQSTISSRGLDIVVALDLSSSMLEEMGRAKPPRSFQNLTSSSRDATLTRAPGENRLTATKHAIKTFVTSRRDDRIGLVVFSDNAYVISPLTFDRDYVVRYVDLVDDQLLRGEGMTSIGDGLALANHLLASASARDAAQRGLRRDRAEARQNSEREGGRQSNGPAREGAPQSYGEARRNQVVVLFTDGENNHGRDPMEVLGESNAANIRVHMVGVDLEEEIRNKPQVQRLFQSVRRYGGRYFNAATAGDLDAASRTIDSVEKGVLVSRSYVRDAPVFQWFALPALLCLAATLGLRAIPFFIDQT